MTALSLLPAEDSLLCNAQWEVGSTSENLMAGEIKTE